jgi:hypothetical protein
MIYATYITHDGAVQYALVRTKNKETKWVVQTLLQMHDYELYPGGIQWFDDEWHARARFERLVSDDITELQEAQE